MKVLAIIPARGGSKGIPKKNIINLNNKPLIEYTIDAAKNSKYIDKVFLSSDDIEIINVAKELKLFSDYIRPSKISDDYATASDVVFDALEWLEKNENYLPDAVLLLQPTSPLRTAEDIDKSIEQFLKDKKSCLVSVHKMVEHPYECVMNIDTDKWDYLVKQDVLATRRQDYRNSFYYINGAIYLVNVNFFREYRTFIKEQNTSFFIMPHERGIDIDEYHDLKSAEYYLIEKVNNANQ